MEDLQEVNANKDVYGTANPVAPFRDALGAMGAIPAKGRSSATMESRTSEIVFARPRLLRQVARHITLGMPVDGRLAPQSALILDLI